MEMDRLSILVVDPEPADHHLIQESLDRSKVPAFLSFATSTEEALRRIHRETYDLILTDHRLPEANAFQILFDLQQRALSIPVIVLTRETEARVARDAFQRGVDDYLLKEELSAVSLFDVIGSVIEKRRMRDEQCRREDILREQAERDGLTGLYNHRFFIDALEREFARAHRYHRPLALLMIDLDGFKSVNDACGHPQGDLLLQKVGRIIQQTVRFVDIVARYGGDEFAILLPETELRQAGRLGERLILEVHQSPFLFDDKCFPISASAGVAVYHPGQSAAGLLLKEADRALYEAKRKGRNRVVLSQTASRTSRNSPPVTRQHLASVN